MTRRKQCDDANSVTLCGWLLHAAVACASQSEMSCVREVGFASVRPRARRHSIATDPFSCLLMNCRAVSVDYTELIAAQENPWLPTHCILALSCPRMGGASPSPSSLSRSPRHDSEALLSHVPGRAFTTEVLRPPQQDAADGGGSPAWLGPDGSVYKRVTIVATGFTVVAVLILLLQPGNQPAMCREFVPQASARTRHRTAPHTNANFRCHGGLYLGYLSAAGMAVEQCMLLLVLCDGACVGRIGGLPIAACATPPHNAPHAHNRSRLTCNLCQDPPRSLFGSAFG